MMKSNSNVCLLWLKHWWCNDRCLINPISTLMRHGLYLNVTDVNHVLWFQPRLSWGFQPGKFHPWHGFSYSKHCWRPRHYSTVCLQRLNQRRGCLISFRLILIGYKKKHLETNGWKCCRFSSNLRGIHCDFGRLGKLGSLQDGQLVGWYWGTRVGTEEPKQLLTAKPHSSA